MSLGARSAGAGRCFEIVGYFRNLGLGTGLGLQERKLEAGEEWRKQKKERGQQRERLGKRKESKKAKEEEEEERGAQGDQHRRPQARHVKAWEGCLTLGRRYRILDGGYT